MALRGRLLLLLLCGALAGALRGTVTVGDPLPLQVSRLLGGAVLLRLNSSSAKLVSEIEWTLRTKGSSRARLIAELRDGQWQLFNSSLGGRLETAEKTVLGIRDLRAEDSGEYKAHVKLTTAQIEEHTFRLTVYEPVPEPRIVLQQTSQTPGGCNVTLRCQAFGKGELNVSWEVGSPPRTLEGGSDWYRLSANGSDLHLSWRPSPVDANISCLASNPADQRKASFDLRSFCSSQGDSQARRKWPILLSLCALVLILAVAILGTWLLKRKRRPQPGK